MLFSRYPKCELVAAIVGPSLASGGFLMMAVMVFDRPYASVQLRLLAFALDLLLAGMTLSLAIQGCKKVLQALP